MSKICRKCGYEADDNAKFCIRCGAHFSEDSEDKTEAKTERAAGETSGKALCRGPSGYKGRKNFFRRARIFGCGRRTGLPFAAGGMPAAPSVAGTAGRRAHGAWSPFCPVIYQINGIKCGKRDNFLYFRRQPMAGLTRLINM